MISVIIPVYNTEKYVSRCIDCVLASACQDFEVILVNDGSTDCSRQICRQYAAKDRRIKSIDQIHKGVSAARNRGIDESRGEWVVFVDSDDVIAPDFLELIAGAEYQEQELLLFDYARRTQKSERGTGVSERRNAVVQHYGKEDRKFLIAGLLNMDQLTENGNVSLASPCAKAYKRDVINRYRIRFPEDIAIGEDRLFNMQYLLRMQSCVYMEEKVYFAQVRPDSAMRGFRPDYLQNDLRYQEKLLNLLNENNIFASVEQAYYNSVLSNMADVLVRGIFHPHSTRSRRENRRLCSRMQESEIYKRALEYNRKMGVLPRRLLLCFYRWKWYLAAELMCKLCYKVLERMERL